LKSKWWAIILSFIVIALPWLIMVVGVTLGTLQEIRDPEIICPWDEGPHETPEITHYYLARTVANFGLFLVSAAFLVSLVLRLMRKITLKILAMLWAMPLIAAAAMSVTFDRLSFAYYDAVHPYCKQTIPDPREA